MHQGSSNKRKARRGPSRRAEPTMKTPEFGADQRVEGSQEYAKQEAEVRGVPGPRAYTCGGQDSQTVDFSLPHTDMRSRAAIDSSRFLTVSDIMNDELGSQEEEKMISSGNSIADKTGLGIVVETTAKIDPYGAAATELGSSRIPFKEQSQGASQGTSHREGQANEVTPTANDSLPNLGSDRTITEPPSSFRDVSEWYRQGFSTPDGNESSSYNPIKSKFSMFKIPALETEKETKGAGEHHAQQLPMLMTRDAPKPSEVYVSSQNAEVFNYGTRGAIQNPEKTSPGSKESLSSMILDESELNHIIESSSEDSSCLEVPGKSKRNDNQDQRHQPSFGQQADKQVAPVGYHDQRACPESQSQSGETKTLGEDLQSRLVRREVVPSKTKVISLFKKPPISPMVLESSESNIPAPFSSAGRRQSSTRGQKRPPLAMKTSPSPEGIERPRSDLDLKLGQSSSLAACAQIDFQKIEKEAAEKATKSRRQMNLEVASQALRGQPQVVEKTFSNAEQPSQVRAAPDSSRLPLQASEKASTVSRLAQSKTSDRRRTAFFGSSQPKSEYSEAGEPFQGSEVALHDHCSSSQPPVPFFSSLVHSQIETGSVQAQAPEVRFSAVNNVDEKPLGKLSKDEPNIFGIVPQSQPGQDDQQNFDSRQEPAPTFGFFNRLEEVPGSSPPAEAACPATFSQFFPSTSSCSHSQCADPRAEPSSQANQPYEILTQLREATMMESPSKMPQESQGQIDLLLESHAQVIESRASAKDKTLFTLDKANEWVEAEKAEELSLINQLRHLLLKEHTERQAKNFDLLQSLHEGAQAVSSRMDQITNFYSGL